MNCNYTISTTLDLYFKELGFVEVCAVRSGTSTINYYFNDITGNTKELVIATNSYSIVDRNDVVFNGFVYKYTDYSSVATIGIFVVATIILIERLLSVVFGLGKE